MKAWLFKIKNYALKKSSKDLGISKKISILRHHFNLSAEALGEKAGVSGTAISNIERGDSLNPGAEMLVNISRMLGVNLNWLLMGEEPMLKNSGTQQQSQKAVDSKTPMGRKKPNATAIGGATVDVMVRVRNPDGTESIMWVEAKALEEIFKTNAIPAVLYSE